MNKKSGKLFIIAGPSGVGKGTILKLFLENNKNAIYSVSTTTRKPRLGEVNGIHYFFTAVENFKEMIKNGEFLEYAEYSGNFYGTSRKFVENKLKKGFDVILEIEVQGAQKVMRSGIKNASIFIMPPSVEELEKRLRGRNTENEEAIKKRLETAKKELLHSKEYKYRVVNLTVEEALLALQKIYESEKNA